LNNSTKRPTKPHPGFSLWIHPSGRWCKKVRGRAHYFGKVADDPDGAAALQQWLDVKDDLLAGRIPHRKQAGLTVADLCNRFLHGKHLMVEAGEMTPRVWSDYRTTCKRILEAWGRMRPVADLRPEDFQKLRAEFASTHGPRRLAKDVQEVRTMFRWAAESGLIEPPRFGPDFKRPSRRVLRAARQANGSRMFEAGEVRTILEAAPQPLRTMVLLAVNAGFGNTDCGELPLSALDLDAGWVDFPRPKTAIPRRCPLWPETAAAIRDTIENYRKKTRPETEALVFVTRWGTAWTHDNDSQNLVTKKFRALLKRLGLYRKGRGFYSLRHVFRTIADGARDAPAANLIMGHVDESMAVHYVERISDERLRRVVEYVRGWLFSSK
jgi:integrase